MNRRERRNGYRLAVSMQNRIYGERTPLTMIFGGYEVHRTGPDGTRRKTDYHSRASAERDLADPNWEQRHIGFTDISVPPSRTDEPIVVFRPGLLRRFEL